VIFGTDFPVLRFERTVEEIEELELRPHVMRKLFSENARRVYKLEAPRS
jgi:predicted TIM-barrel fold metal-dependent hydrolase